MDRFSQHQLPVPGALRAPMIASGTVQVRTHHRLHPNGAPLGHGDDVTWGGSTDLSEGGCQAVDLSAVGTCADICR